MQLNIRLGLERRGDDGEGKTVSTEVWFAGGLARKEENAKKSGCGKGREVVVNPRQRQRESVVSGISTADDEGVEREQESEEEGGKRIRGRDMRNVVWV